MFHRTNDINALSLEPTDTITKKDIKDFQQHYNKMKSLFYKFLSSSVWFGFPVGSHYGEHNYWCHSAFGGHNVSGVLSESAKTRGIIDFQTRNFRPKINKAFMDFLLSETESPWRTALKDVTVITDNTQIPDLPVAFVLRNTRDTPIRVFVNLLVAGRMKASWGLDWVWWNFVNTGFSKPTAMILSSLFSWDGQTLTVGNCPGKHNMTDNPTGSLGKDGPYMSDQPFYTYFGFYPKDFIEGRPSFKPEDTLDAGCPPQPCSPIWNRMKTNKQGDLLHYKNISNAMNKPYWPKLIGRAKNANLFAVNARGILDCAWKGIKMSPANVNEIEDSFRNEIYVEV